MNAESDGAAFVEWARSRAVPISIPPTDVEFRDLCALDEFIGDARVVALGESSHYVHEWNRFRCRLFKYLVERHGFTSFVLESALVEGRRVHDWVLGEEVDWTHVVRDSITNAWGFWLELQELLHWMRSHNARATAERKLRFYGMDGSANWSHARFAVRGLLAYILQVDARLAKELTEEVLPLAERAALEAPSDLSPAEWNELLAGMARCLGTLEQNRVVYQERSDESQYAWALRFGQVARDILAMLAGVERRPDQAFFLFWNARDSAMADQLMWILEREGPDARVLVGAHNVHLQDHSILDLATPLGQYCSHRLGREQMRLIAAANARTLKPGDEPLAESNQAAYAAVGSDSFFLDLRGAPEAGPVREWLDTERPERINLQYHPVAPGRAWDAILYTRQVRLATLALPREMHHEPVEPDPTHWDDWVGRYRITGFLGQEIVLNVERDGERLIADGLDDPSSEMFPPSRHSLVPIGPDRFTWDDWPAVIQFGREEGEIRACIEMPAMGAYCGPLEPARTPRASQAAGGGWRDRRGARVGQD